MQRLGKDTRDHECLKRDFPTWRGGRPARKAWPSSESAGLQAGTCRCFRLRCCRFLGPGCALRSPVSYIANTFLVWARLSSPGDVCAKALSLSL